MEGRGAGGAFVRPAVWSLLPHAPRAAFAGVLPGDVVSSAGCGKVPGHTNRWLACERYLQAGLSQARL